MSSLYLHIPFCENKCHYCGFNSYADCEAIWERYFNALQRELISECKKYGQNFTPLKTVFFGGGTPTLVEAKYLTEVIATLRDCVELESDCEISVESNPESVSLEKLEQLWDSGINRLSFGVQSFKDDDLRTLGRIHSADKAAEVMALAKQAGFTNINLDLMSGLRGQSRDDWSYILSRAISCEPSHLSIYQLTPEENTPLYNQIEKGLIELPDGEHSLELDRITQATCAEYGYQQYEISNFAIPGFECRHNINYWENNSYLAVGAGAVSYINGCRAKRVGSPAEYCKNVECESSVISEKECLTKEESFRETVVVGLRMVRGVDLKRVENRFEIDICAYYGSILDSFREAGFVEISDGFLFITDKGRPVTNRILTDLV